MNETLKAFGYPKTLIKEFNHWAVLLRPAQVTIGSLVIVNKSQALNLGELSTDEWTEFSKVSAFCEELLNKTFRPDKFNYLALMMKDPNVHFHFIPRYSDPVKINNVEYSDVDWPNKTELNKLEINEDVFADIKSKLESEL